MRPQEPGATRAAPAALAALAAGDRESLHELAPVLRRAVTLDARGLVRIRLVDGAATALVRLPFGVLVSRTVEAPARHRISDVTARAVDLLAWLDGDTEDLPPSRDVEWRSALPPAAGWSRIESVPEDVVRPLVRSGATALRDAAAREGVPGAQPRAEVADALLDSTVLTVEDDTGQRAEVTLRALSALTRMNFLPPGGRTLVDVHGRWTRVVAEYGTVYLEQPGGLTLS